MAMIPLEEAAALLGMDSSGILTNRKYKPFIRYADKGKKNAAFDYSGFIKYDNAKEELREKTMLFTEYLNKLENVRYQDIAKVAGVSTQSIGNLSYGHKAAMKIVTAFMTFRPFHFIRFHEYYGYRYTLDELIEKRRVA